MVSVSAEVSSFCSSAGVGEADGREGGADSEKSVENLLSIFTLVALLSGFIAAFSVSVSVSAEVFSFCSCSSAGVGEAEF